MSAIANFHKFWGKTNKESNNIKFVRPSGIIERREEIWISSEASKQSESPILQYSKPGYARLSGQWSAVNIGLIYIQWQGQIGGKYLPFVEHWNQFSRSKYFGKEKSGSAFSGSVFFPLLELLITVVTFITLITGKGAVFAPMFYSTSTATNFVLSPTCEWYTFGYCTTFSHFFLINYISFICKRICGKAFSCSVLFVAFKLVLAVVTFITLIKEKWGKLFSQFILHTWIYLFFFSYLQICWKYLLNITFGFDMNKVNIFWWIDHLLSKR